MWLSILYQEKRRKNEQLLECVTKLQDENNHLQKSQSELTSNIDHLSRENDRLAKEAQMLTVQLEREMTRLSKALEEKDKTLEEQEEKLEKQEEKLEEQEEKLEEWDKKLEEQDKKLGEQEDKYHELQQMLDKEKDDKERLEVELKQQKQEYDRELGRVGTEKNQLEELGRQFEQSWRISHKDITMTGEKIGAGAYGGVSVGVFREQRVAVKQLHDLIMSKDNLALMNREISTMSRLRHPNLLLFIGAALDHPSSNPLLIIEIMDTSLRKAYERKQLTEDGAKLLVLRDTAAGLNYLHCHPDEIIHRDVSSANILLESRGPNKWRAKLSDFGSANIARKSFTQAPGAAVYGAPEALAVSVVNIAKKKPQTTKVDVFSYGILVCEVMIGQFPDIEQFHAMLQSVLGSHPPLGQLVQDCISEDPADRPTMKIVISNSL